MSSTYRSYTQSQLKLLQKMGITKISLVTEESPGCLLAHEYLKTIAAAHGITVLGEEVVNPETRDFRASILRLITKKPESVVLTLNPVANVLIVKQFREVAPHLPLLGYFDITQGEDRALIEGLPFVAQFKTDPDFEQRFKQTYGHAFTARAPQAYDIIKLLALVHEKQVKKLKGLELIRALSGIHGVKGAAGLLDTHGTKTIESECVWKIIRNGEQEILTESEVGPSLLQTARNSVRAD